MGRGEGICVEDYRHALDGYEVQKTHIDAKIAELRAMLNGGSTEPAVMPEPTKRKPRKMSAAGRKAISEATKKRWAAYDKERRSIEKSVKALGRDLVGSPDYVPKKRRQMSKSQPAAIKRNAAKARAAKKATVTKRTLAKKTAPAPAMTVAEAAAQ